MKHWILIFLLYTGSTALAQVTQLTPDNKYCLLSYYNMTIDSPDGKLIIYTEITELNGNATVGRVCVSDLNGEQSCTAITVATNKHVGAFPIWIDNKRIAFCDMKNGNLYVAEVAKGGLKVSKKVESLGFISDYSELNGTILLTSYNRLEIISYDPYSDEIRTIINSQEIEQQTGVSIKSLKHPKWSPNTSKIMLAGNSETNKSLFVSDQNGKNIKLVFKDKPIHQQWYDNNFLFAHDRVTRDLFLYNLNGEKLIKAAGYGNHCAISSDKNFIATESWYDDDPVILRLYEVGKPYHSQELVTQTASVKGKSFWTFAHMHPSFSRDDTKVFFNSWKVGDRYPSVSYFEIGKSRAETSSLKGSVSLTNQNIVILNSSFPKDKPLRYSIYDFTGLQITSSLFTLDDINNRITIVPLRQPLTHGNYVLVITDEFGVSTTVKYLLQ